MPTIKQLYNKAYRNYLRRINTAVRSGYQPEVRERVKTPTRASIRALERLTGQKIRESAPIVNLITGELVTTSRHAIATQNRQFLKLSPQEQELSREVGKVTRVTVDESEVADGVDIIINKWLTFLETAFKPETAQYLKEKTEYLLNIDRDTFAYVLYRNPDLFPEAGDSDRQSIDLKFAEIRDAMGFYDDISPAGWSEFMDALGGIVEREE